MKFISFQNQYDCWYESNGRTKCSRNECTVISSWSFLIDASCFPRFIIDSNNPYILRMNMIKIHRLSIRIDFRSIELHESFVFPDTFHWIHFSWRNLSRYCMDYCEFIFVEILWWHYHKIPKHQIFYLLSSFTSFNCSTIIIPTCETEPKNDITLNET